MVPRSLLGWWHILGKGADEISSRVVVSHNNQLAGSRTCTGRAQLRAGLPDDLREMTGTEAAWLAAKLVLLDLTVP